MESTGKLNFKLMLSVTFSQASFVAEGQELLQQAKDEMEALAAAVAQAQVRLNDAL
jgi:hypothetical protein